MQKKTQLKVSTPKKATTKRPHSKKAEEKSSTRAGDIVEAAFRWMLTNPEKAKELFAITQQPSDAQVRPQMIGEEVARINSTAGQPQPNQVKEIGSNLVNVNDRVLYLEERLQAINSSLVYISNRLKGSAEKYETKMDEHKEGNLINCIHVGIDNVGAYLNYTQSIISSIAETL